MPDRARKIKSSSERAQIITRHLNNCEQRIIELQEVHKKEAIEKKKKDKRFEIGCFTVAIIIAILYAFLL